MIIFGLPHADRRDVHLHFIPSEVEKFDRRLGTSGLHRVGGRVEVRERATVLPPALFASFAGDALWRDGPNPGGVKVV